MDMERYTDKLQEEATRRIRAGRKSKSMSQQDMSKAMEEFGLRIGPSAYAKLERGERALSFIEAMALVRILNISLADLIPQHHDIQDEILRQVNNIYAQSFTIADSCDDLAREAASLKSKMDLLQTDVKNSSENIVIPGLQETATSVSNEQVQEKIQSMIEYLGKFSETLDEFETPVEAFRTKATNEGWISQDGSIVPGAEYIDGND